LSDILLSTKIHIPPLRSNIVTRQQLIQRLNDGISQNHRLILISAPAGYGKSTLLSEWVSQINLPVAWLSLEKGENNPVRFWSYFATALSTLPQMRQAGIGEAFLQVLESPQPPTMDILLINLVNDLSKIEAKVVLVLDDLHSISEGQIHQDLVFLIEHLAMSSHGLHLVVAGRMDPPWPLARWRGRGELTEVRTKDLRFSPEEATIYLNTIMGLKLDSGEVTVLEQRTEGWIAGLQLAGLSLQGRENVSSFIHSFSGANRYILDFLFEEVFQQQSEEHQNFLLQTSILDQLCGSLCNAVTQQSNSQVVLDALERGNLFLVALDEERKWYRYHHLFGELLKKHLKQIYPQLSIQLHRRASAWYASENDFENAITHLLAAQEYESAARLIEQSVHSLDTHRKQSTLMVWLESLPREILDIHPFLCIYRAWGNYFAGRRNLNEEWLQVAEKAICGIEQENPEVRLIKGRIAAIRALLALAAEDLPSGLEMGQNALALLPEGDSMIFDTWIALAGVYEGLGDLNQALQAYYMAKVAGQKINKSMEADATCYLGTMQIKQGHLHEALATFTDALHQSTLPSGYEIPAAGFAKVKIGDLYREWNNLQLASQYLSRGVEQCIQYNQPDVIAEAYIFLGSYMLAIGDPQAAQTTLQKADQVVKYAKVDPFLLTWLDDCHLKIWLAQGDLQAATHWARNSGISLDGPLSYLYDLHHQNLARVLVAEGIQDGSRASLEQATYLLERLQKAAQQVGWVDEEIKILVLQAVNFQALGMGEEALNSLARAIYLAAPGGYVRVFLDEGGTLRGLITSLGNILSNNRLNYQHLLGIDPQGDELDRLRQYVIMLHSKFEQLASQITPKVSAPAQAGRHRIAALNHTTPKLIEPLSERELQVLRLLQSAMTSEEISRELFISVNTTRTHIRNIYSKLAVHGRITAIQKAKELDLI
jgi:ATP/maltotriose-dependent transcriptional regulator MalT